MLRLFIAISLPTPVQEYLADTGRGFATQVPNRSVRWVKADRMHLTLRFLGDTQPSKVSAISQGLDSTAKQFQPFALQLGQLGCFPNPRNPRVIWVGLDGETGKLTALKREVDMALEPLGWKPETKRFKAHLTLGRVKHSHNQIKLAWGDKLESLLLPVNSIHLIKSVLSPAGSTYTTLHQSQIPNPKSKI